MNRQLRVLMASTLALAASAPLARAADEPLGLIDTVEVTGREFGQRQLHTLDTPALSVGIGEAQIAAVNAYNVEDTFRYAPDLIVRKRYVGDSNALLSFRGAHSTQSPTSLVMVDGFVISNFLGADFFTAPKWALVAPGDVDRVEVIYGPTSARYSGNSLGGTLLLKTRDITRDEGHLSLQAFGQDYDYYATHETLGGWAADMGFDFRLNDRAALSLGYRHFENHGQPQEWRFAAAGSPYADQAILETGLGFPQRVAAQDSVVRTVQDQFRLRGTLDLGGDWTARTLVGLLMDDEDTSEPESFLVDETGAPTFIGIDGVVAGIHDKAELLVGLGLKGRLAGWTVDVAASRFDALHDRTRQSNPYDTLTGLEPRSGLRLDEGDAAWTSLEASGERTFGRHALAVGLSYAGYTFQNRTHNTDDWRRALSTGLRDAAGGETRLAGLFVEDAVMLADAWTATLGLRAESWRAADGYLATGGERVDYPARSREALSPKAALTFQPDMAWKFVASAALATRFPTVKELYQPGLISYGADVGELDLNGFNPDLEPETGLDLQFTVTRSFRQAVLTVSAYRQAVEDAIFAQTLLLPSADDPDTIEQQSLNTNIGKVVTNGVDVILAAQNVLVRGLAVDANLSLLDSKVKRNPLNPGLEGNHFPRVPNIRANASLRYSPDDAWTFAAGWRYQDTPYRNIENTANARCATFWCVTSFSYVDLKATRRIGDVELSLGVDNVFDEKAFVYHPYPGRMALLELTWRGGL